MKKMEETQYQATSCSCNSHKHDHNHGKLPTIMFFVGLGLFLVSLFLIEGIIQNILYIVSVMTAGYHVIGEGFGDTIKATMQRKRFTPNIHLLMALSAFGAIFIGDYREAALLILIFAGAHFLEDYAENKSKTEITKLLKMNPNEARILDEMNNTTLVEVSALKIGDRVKVLQGDQIPIDGIVLSGNGSIDESSITGESIPVDKTINDIVYGTTILTNGDMVISVTKTSEDTVFSQIIKLVSTTQSNVSKTAAMIKRIEPIYVKLVLAAAPIIYLILYFGYHYTFDDAFYKVMVFLTVASPCALAATDIPATLSALSNLARQGILFKGGSYLANFADIKAISFDKTGTLTIGKPEVTDVYYIEQKQEYVDILVAMEHKSNHPLAKAIVSHFDVVNTLELEVSTDVGVGISAIYNSNTYRIGKPSSYNSIEDKVQKQIDFYTSEGKTAILFSIDETIVIVIAMQDMVNPQSSKVIDYFKSQDIKTVMVSGDSQITANAIGNKLDIDVIHGNILPENKSEIIQELKDEYGSVAMVGDGINDAPALVLADIGFAMGEGSDIAIDVADSVIMKDDIKKLAYTHRVSKKLKSIVIQNIIFSILVVIVLLFMTFITNLNLPMGVVFHEGSTIIVILNGLRLLKDLK